MSQPQQSDSSPTPRPTCPSCGQPMRFVTAVPATLYKNLTRATFTCNCGWTSDFMIADED